MHINQRQIEIYTASVCTTKPAVKCAEQTENELCISITMYILFSTIEYIKCKIVIHSWKCCKLLL